MMPRTRQFPANFTCLYHMPHQPRLCIALCALLLLLVNPIGALGPYGMSSRGRSRQARPAGVHLARQLLQSTNSSQCAKSWLGYQCTKLVCGRIRIHWSLGGPPPSGPGCSYGDSQVGAPDSASQLLHIALQTDALGYVAASWPTKKGHMAPADAVIGGFDSSGNTSVLAYSLSSESANGVQQDPNVVITDAKVESNATSLTVCFTRNITQVGKQTGVMIEPSASTDMCFVASATPLKMQHLHGTNYQCSAALTFLSATGGPDDGLWRPTNLTADTASMMMGEQDYMRAHGALQFTGWIVMVPGGMLAARHRWLFNRFGVKGAWFQVHRVVQMLAITLVVIGFILPWTTFGSDDADALEGEDHEAHMAEDPLLQAHELLAFTLMLALGLHLVLAVARPKPDDRWRGHWNLLHWWTGRALAVVAGINVVIGIMLWRRASDSSGVGFIVALVVFGVGWLGLAAWLEWRAPEGRGLDIVQVAPALLGGYTTVSSSGVPPAGEVPMSPLGQMAGVKGHSNLSGNEL